MREPGETRRMRSSGLSLVEVMVALSILSFGVLAVAAMQIQAMGGGARGRHVSTAAMVARDQIENIQRVPFSQIQLKNWGATEGWMTIVGLTRGDVDVVVAQESGSSATEQTYSVDWRISQVTPPNPDLRNVELAVTWQEPDQSAPKRLALSTIVVNNKR